MLPAGNDMVGNGGFIISSCRDHAGCRWNSGQPRVPAPTILTTAETLVGRNSWGFGRTWPPITEGYQHGGTSLRPAICAGCLAGAAQDHHQSMWLCACH